jgi:hypothetical protein
MLSFEIFPDGCSLIANVSEHYSPMKMEQTECSETLAFTLQTPGNNAEESIRNSKRGESF